MIADGLKKLKRMTRGRAFDFLMNYLMKPGYERKGRAPFNSDELKLLRHALLSQNLCCIDGKMVVNLEKEFAYTYGVPYAVASTSGTAAIHVALGALDLNPGDEVITAPITDLGTVIPILYQNAIPVFADVDNTYNMDPASVEQRITSRTRAIIVVHLFGNPCNMDAMVEIARRNNIPLIEDCAQAHMTDYKGKYVGTVGDIGCFSFQQSKHMTTGDGGMTITSNEAYYDRMKFFADKGFARKGYGPRAYLFHAPNYRMTELVGAVGLAQLKKVKAVVERRHELGEYMTELLSNIDGVTTAPVTEGAKHSYWLYPLRIDGADIDEFERGMRQEKVSVMPRYTGKPIYLCTESLTAKKTYGQSQCPFTCNGTTGTYEYKEGLCPRAEEALNHLVCIPLNESWNKQEVQRVAGAIKKYLGRQGTSRIYVPESEKQGSAAVLPKKTNAKVLIGIIGCGQMGRWHLDSYKKNPNTKVVAVVDTNFEKAQTFAQMIDARPYSSYLEMIEKESLDGVSLCSVPSTHRDIALDLLNAGMNVLCEKPLAISVHQAEEMSKKAKEKNLLLFTAFKFRFYDAVLKAKDLIASGSMGNILNFRLMFGGYIDMTGTWYAKKEIAGGGVIMDNGPHATDLIHNLFGNIKTIGTQTSSHQNLEVEDTAQLNVCLENGVIGTSDLSWSIRMPSKSYLEIYGDDGAALLDPEGISYRFKTWDDWKRIPNQVSIKEAFARQIDHFVGAIMGETHLTLGNGEGLKSQAAIEAAYESVRQNRNVNVKYGG